MAKVKLASQGKSEKMSSKAIITSTTTDTLKQSFKQAPSRESLLFQNLGVPGDNMTQWYVNEERRLDDLTIPDYRRMTENDGQVQMLINAIKNTILSNGWEIEDDPDYLKELKPDEIVDSEEKVFVEQNLLNPIHKNGLSRDINLTIRTMLRAFEEGYRVFEVVYRKGDEGKIYLDQLAPRAVRYSDFDLRLIIDNKGAFMGFHQQVNAWNQPVDIQVINASDISKVINVVWGAEYGSNYGRPGLKPIWYHYDKLHKLLYLLHVGSELGAVKYRHVKKKGRAQSDTTDKELISILQKAGLQSVVMYDDEAYELIIEDLSDAQILSVAKDMVNYHTGQIAKAWLAQFVDLGSNTSDTGARALGETQLEFFLIGVQSLAKILIEEPMNKIIADLVRINFDDPVYPTFKVRKIDKRRGETLLTMITELVKKGDITPSIKTKVIEEAVTELNIKIDTEKLNDEILEEEESKKQEREAMNQVKMAPNEMKVQQKEDKQPKGTNLAETAMNEVSEMEIYPDQSNVDFAGIKIRLNGVSSILENSLRNVLSTKRDEVIDAYINASRKGLKAINSTKVSLEEVNVSRYSQTLLNSAMEVMEFGKVQAAQELDIKAPSTPTNEKQYVESKIDRIIQEQSARLTLKLQEVAQKAMDANIPEQKGRLLLVQEFDNFFDGIIDATVTLILYQFFNRGREITASSSYEIIAARYTARLESGRVCPYCMSLHGRVFQMNDPERAMLEPPQHYRCECVWTYLTRQMMGEYNIVITGKPEGLPIFSSVSTFTNQPVNTIGEDDIAIEGL